MMTRFYLLFLAVALTVGSAVAPLSAQTPAPAPAVANANTVAEADLARLPHMNATIARALIAQRPFANVTVLDRFLTEQKLTRMQIGEVYARLFVPVNLNTATDAEILLIPGMGQRMLREFKEYRPYKAMEQFRREIGKYVSTEEVARFERYVTLN